MKKYFCFNILSLLFKPEEAWKELSQQPQKGYTAYTYICIGLVMLSHFLASFIHNPSNWKEGLFTAILALFVVIGSLFCSVIALRFLYKHLQQQELSFSKAMAFTSYSCIAIYTLAILRPFISELFQFLAIGTLFIVWPGCESFLEISKENKVTFSIQFTLLVVVFYLGISLILP